MLVLPLQVGLGDRVNTGHIVEHGLTNTDGPARLATLKRPKYEPSDEDAKPKNKMQAQTSSPYVTRTADINIKDTGR